MSQFNQEMISFYLILISLYQILESNRAFFERTDITLSHPIKFVKTKSISYLSRIKIFCEKYHLTWIKISKI